MNSAAPSDVIALDFAMATTILRTARSTRLSRTRMDKSPMPLLHHSPDSTLVTGRTAFPSQCCGPHRRLTWWRIAISRPGRAPIHTRPSETSWSLPITSNRAEEGLRPFAPAPHCW